MIKSKIKNIILLCIIFTVLLGNDTQSLADNNVIVDKVEKATVLVYFDYVVSITPLSIARSQGSGFLVSENGYVITNAHVITQNIIDTIKVLVENKTNYKAQVVRIDYDYDLAIIKIMGDVKFQHYLQLATDEEIVDGNKAYFMGYPLLQDFQTQHIGTSSSISEGLIKKKEQFTSISKSKMHIIEISSDANPGNSGGPLFIPENGKVIGVITKKFDKTGISFAIPITYVRALYFESLGLVQTNQSENTKNPELKNLLDIIVYELKENQSVIERNSAIFSQNIELLAEGKILTTQSIPLHDSAWKKAKIEKVAILNSVKKNISEQIQKCYYNVAHYNELLDQRKRDSEGINRAMSNYLERLLANEKLLLTQGSQLTQDINNTLEDIKLYRDEL